MQYTGGGEFGLIEHDHVSSYISRHPLQVLLLLEVVHASNIPQSNGHCSPPPFPDGCGVDRGGVNEGWCINVHVLGLHLLSTIARYHWLPNAGGDKLVKGIFEEELTVEEPISASAFTI